MKATALFSLAVYALLVGCTDPSYPHDQEPKTNVVEKAPVRFVCIGMENSERFGKCPGCKYDSDRMNSFFTQTYGYEGKLLQSDQATRKAVAVAINEAVELTPTNGLFILYYSGHGGQENLSSWNNEEPEGADSDDEYLCLYDSYLLDDEIWQLITPCKGRVFLIFDACHSQTLFRSITEDIAKEQGLAVPLDSKLVKSSGFKLRPLAISLEMGSINMLCWSGCMEKEYSYGSSAGGVMTNILLKRWYNGISYCALWTYIETGVQKEQPTQHPQCTQYGTGFEEAFR